MTLEEQLESFYVDAGLTDEAERGDLAQEGDVERWLNQARIKIGPVARRSAALYWEADDTVIDLPRNCYSISRIVVDSGYSLPPYDEWGQVLALRQPATGNGSATVFYTGYFDPVSTENPQADDPTQDAVGLACVSYALSRFFRKLASSRVDYRRYSTLTGQSGIEAADLRDLADDHLADFESAKNDLFDQASSSYYGD